MNKIRSSRNLMRECGRNVELWFLLNRLQPDFRTIADFRMAHRKLLKKIFVVFARSCREMKLMDGGTLCLDGTTIRASNGRKQSTSVELSRKKLEYARAQLEAVERFLDGMDENDLHEDRIDHPFALDLDKDHLPDPQTLRERIAFHEKYIEELEKSGRSAMTFTDPECAMMPAKEGGIKACYNVQTMVDASSHMIADFHVTDSPSDRGQIFESVELCRKNLGLESVNVIADKGYESAEDIENCLMNGVAADVGFIQDREERVFSLDYMEREITPEQKASRKPEDIQACLRAGVLPDCYPRYTRFCKSVSIIPAAPELPSLVLVFQIPKLFVDHQAAFPLQVPHEARYRYLRRYAHQPMYMIRTDFRFMNFDSFLFAQLPQDLPDHLPLFSGISVQTRCDICNSM